MSTNSPSEPLSALASTVSSHPVQRRLPIWPLRGKSIASQSSSKASAWSTIDRSATLSATLKLASYTLLLCPIRKDDIARLFHTSSDTRPFDASASAWSRNEVAVFVRDLYLILTHELGLGVIQV